MKGVSEEILDLSSLVRQGSACYLGCGIPVRPCLRVVAKQMHLLASWGWFFAPLVCTWLVCKWPKVLGQDRSPPLHEGLAGKLEFAILPFVPLQLHVYWCIVCVYVQYLFYLS